MSGPRTVGNYVEIAPGVWRDLTLHKEAKARKLYGPKWKQLARKAEEERQKAMAAAEAEREKTLTQRAEENAAPVEIKPPETEI